MKKIFYLFYLFLSSNIISQENSIELPLIGDRLSGAVSETEEEILGRQFLRDLKRETDILYDPIIQEWTELFVYKIGESSKVNKKTFEILVIEDNRLNAFAAPGGVIGINAGLFKHADNEAQFASVVAHELAHLSQRHFARQILENSDRSNANMATILASIVVAVASRNPAALIGGQGLLVNQRLRFSRLYESEADREGFITLEKSGYKTSEMSEMFKNMQEIRRLSGDNIPEFLLTHMLSPESRLISCIFLNISDISEVLYPDNLIIKTTIAETLTESGNINRSKSYTEELLDISLGNYPISFNLAKTYILEGDYIAAEQILEDIKFYRPVDINLLKLLGEVQQKSNNMLSFHLTNSEYLFYSGRYEEALADLYQARRLAVNNFKIKEIITERIVFLQKYLGKIPRG